MDLVKVSVDMHGVLAMNHTNLSSAVELDWDSVNCTREAHHACVVVFNITTASKLETRNIGIGSQCQRCERKEKNEEVHDGAGHYLDEVRYSDERGIERFAAR